MGTQFRISLYASNPESARAAADVAFDRIDKLEEVLSDYQADSELSLLREHPPGTSIRISEDLFDVLWSAEKISRATSGTFDVTAGPYTRLWRFSRKRKALPSATELAEASNSVGYEKLILNRADRTVTMCVPGMRLDVGGIAKGYAADAALAKLRSLGFNRALVAASGDIAIGDPPPDKRGWNITISPPGGSDQEVLRTLLLRNAGVSTSGDTEQFVEIEGVRYSHILHPETGVGMTNQVQVTVVAQQATLSDSLATSLRIAGPQDGLKFLRKFRGASALIMEVHGTRTNMVSRGSIMRQRTGRGI